MNIVLFGSSGQLGSWLIPPLEAYGHVQLNPGFSLVETMKFLDYCAAQHVDAVINAAGWNNKWCIKEENSPGGVHRVNQTNGIWPRELAAACHIANIPLYHLSTEYVFSANNGEGPFNELKDPLPDSLYGRS